MICIEKLKNGEVVWEYNDDVTASMVNTITELFTELKLVIASFDTGPDCGMISGVKVSEIKRILETKFKHFKTVIDFHHERKNKKTRIFNSSANVQERLSLPER